MLVYKTSAKSKSLSSKTNNELVTMSLTENGSKMDAIVQEAWRRQHAGLMYMLASADKIVSNPSFFNIILKYVQTTKDETNKVDVLHAMLSHDPSIYNGSYTKGLISMANTSSMASAMTLISHGTPLPVVSEIIKRSGLNDPRAAIFADASFVGSKVTQQNKILEAIYQLLKEGYSFENLYASGILLKRVEINSSDKFIAEMARFNMHPEIAGEFDKISKQWGKYNPLLARNFASNNSEGVQNFKASQSVLTIEQNPEEIIPEILEFLKNETRINSIQHFFGILKYKCSQYPQVFNVCLHSNIDGRNIFVEFASENADICGDCSKFVFEKMQKYGYEIYSIKDVAVKLATMAIYDFGLKDIIGYIPKDILEYVPLRTEDREKTTKPKTDTQSKPQPYNFAYPKIRASKKDWYKYAKLVSDI